MKLYSIGVFLVMMLILAACAAQQVAPPTIVPMVTTIAFPTATATAITTATLRPSATATIDLPISPAASAYLEEALDIIQNNSIYRHSIDWNALRKTAFQMAEHAQTPADTYGTIRYVLSVLGDHHSSFWTPYEVVQVEQVTANESLTPRGKLLLGKLGYIAVEGFRSGNMEEGAQYALLEQQLIRDLDAQNPCGWIVDLRENTVGNIWPMLAGIGPILGEGKAGAFVDSDGDQLDWSYQDGQAKQGDVVVIKVNGPPYRLKEAFPPVAVLTGVNTKSSGEFIVVSFRGRPHTRSFGLYTAGLSTDNFDFRLSDGAGIALTVGVFADRTGQAYGDRIYPDELVDDVRKYTYIMDAAIPQPAIDWLMSQPECLAQ